MIWGHGYWRTVALRVADFKRLALNDEPYKVTLILQRCDHCGKLREVRFTGDWGDYADGIYEPEAAP